MEYVNLKVCNIKGVNERKTHVDHISCDCRCEFDGKKWNSGQKWNDEKCYCEC